MTHITVVTAESLADSERFGRAQALAGEGRKVRKAAAASLPAAPALPGVTLGGAGGACAVAAVASLLATRASHSAWPGLRAGRSCALPRTALAPCLSPPRPCLSSDWRWSCAVVVWL